MDEMEKGIVCKVHGDARPAYVCRHLFENPIQEWFSELASLDNRCPDAWCGECEKKFQASEGWSEENSNFADIKMLCQHCYDDKRGESVPYCMSRVDDEWSLFSSNCIHRLSGKQDSLQDAYRINDHKRWDWDQGTSSLVFSNDGVSAVSADIQFVGSISDASGTWLWAWANPSLESKSRKAVERVRGYGETSGFTNLQVPIWSADEVDGWEMTAVAVEILGARGAYRTPSENGFTYLAITEIGWVS